MTAGLPRAAAIVGAAMLAAGVAMGSSVCAQTQQVVVVVNDQAITDYDVTQRMRLNEILGYSSGRSEAERRKEALEELIDDVIKQIEAKKNKVSPTAKQIDDAMERMAKGTGTTREGLAEKLKAKGVSIRTLQAQVTASIAFNWLISRKYNVSVKVDPAEVDRRYETISSDPRLKPVAVYEIMEISLPIDATSEANAQQILYARAIEAQQIMQRFSGCGSARQATSGIFNVKVSKVIQAPVEQLPKDMKAVLDKTGPGRLIGPMRAPKGIQLIAYCGRTSVSPPKPSREIVENILINEKYKVATQRIMRDLRRTVYIDYKVKP
jgi:peptidyl-prolyl cis-trans isomerase SurA